MFASDVDHRQFDDICRCLFLSTMKRSVIICTYNGGARLVKVLHCLSVQTGLSRDSWELLIVDNASTDGRSMSRAIDASAPMLSPSNGSATLKENPPMTSGNASPA